MGDILFFAEHQVGILKGYSEELASHSVRLAKSLGGKAVGVTFGAGAARAAAALGAFGVVEAVAVEGESVKEYVGEIYAASFLSIVASQKPQVILASSTSSGKDLLPRLLVPLKAGLATDCVDLKIDGGKLKAHRPIFAGKALVDVTFSSAMQMATSRPNSFPTEKISPDAKANVKTVAPAATPNLRVQLKEIKQSEKKQIDLTEAEFIVSGGRSLASADNFKIIQALADMLGGAVGASRAAVDAGYISHDHQVGQTGKTVNPKLYIACGISGAIQHLAGMRTSKVIVAINKDAEAPIVSKADYAIVGDLFQIVPLLTEKLKTFLKR